MCSVQGRALGKGRRIGRGMSIELHSSDCEMADLMQLAIEWPWSGYNGSRALDECIGGETQHKAEEVAIAFVPSCEQIVGKSRLMYNGHERPQVMEVEADDG